MRTPSVVHLVYHHFTRGTDNRDQIISLHVIDLNGDGPNISFFFYLVQGFAFFPILFTIFFLSITEALDRERKILT